MRLSAAELDRRDPLSAFRDRFVIGDPNLIYLDGNSLGRLPKATAERLRDVVERQWGAQLIRSWGECWLDLPTRVGDKIGQLIGARRGEVIACDSTSVNLYKLAHAVLAGTDRRRIVSDRANFPSDLYLLQGLADHFPGVQITLVDSEDSDAIEAALTNDVALLTLSQVSFRTGRLHDMPRLTAAAHAVGAMTLWDLSHSAGAVPVDLAGARADLAVGCTYKYLNGGPGAVAYLYVRQEHQERLQSPIWGWFGQKDAFAFDLAYAPKTGIERFLAGTPPILSLAAVESGVDLLLEAGMGRIRQKSIALSTFLIDQADALLAEHGFEVVTPRDPENRGSHVTLAHPEAWRVNQALIHEMSLIPDFRTPNGLRLGLAPLYNTFSEVEEAVRRILLCTLDKTFRNYPADRSPVT